MKSSRLYTWAAASRAAHMEVSIHGGTPESSMLMGFSLINHPFWGTPIDGNPHMEILQWVNLVCVYEYVNPYIKTSS